LIYKNDDSPWRVLFSIFEKFNLISIIILIYYVLISNSDSDSPLGCKYDKEYYDSPVRLFSIKNFFINPTQLSWVGLKFMILKMFNVYFMDTHIIYRF